MKEAPRGTGGTGSHPGIDFVKPTLKIVPKRDVQIRTTEGDPSAAHGPENTRIVMEVMGKVDRRTDESILVCKRAGHLRTDSTCTPSFPVYPLNFRRREPFMIEIEIRMGRSLRDSVTAAAKIRVMRPRVLDIRITAGP